MIGFSQILCPVDFSDYSRRALEYAVAMGRWYGAQVTALHVSSDLPVIDAVPLYRGQVLTLSEVDITAVRATLSEFVAAVAGPFPVTTAVAHAVDVRDETVARAADLKADLIVMGTHGRAGFERLLAGSVAERVGHQADCPVMFVPPGVVKDSPPPTVPFTRIVCAVDFGRDSAEALELAIGLAEESDAHLTLMHAIEVPPELRESATPGEIDVAKVRAAAEAEALANLRAMVPAEARVYCKVHTDVREGRAHTGILHVADESDADLIIMGVRHHHAVDRLFFGSNTHAVLCGARCPVIAVKTRRAAGPALGG